MDVYKFQTYRILFLLRTESKGITIIRLDFSRVLVCLYFVYIIVHKIWKHFFTNGFRINPGFLFLSVQMSKQNNELNIEPLKVSGRAEVYKLMFLEHYTYITQRWNCCPNISCLHQFFTADCLTGQNSCKIIERISLVQNLMNFKCRQQRQ